MMQTREPDKSGSCFATEWGYAIAFLFFMVVIFIRPQGLFGGKS